MGSWRRSSCGRSGLVSGVDKSAAADQVGIERPLRFSRKGTIPPSMVSSTKSWRETLMISSGHKTPFAFEEGVCSIIPPVQNQFFWNVEMKQWQPHCHRRD